MNKNEIIEKIITYFEDNNDIFTACIEELDSYNGYLNDDRYYPMEEFDELHAHYQPLELAQRIFFGDFNPNHDYFRYNGYGNLVSSDWIDYSDHLDRRAVESMAENRYWIDSIDSDDTLKELFNALENTTDAKEV